MTPIASHLPEQTDDIYRPTTSPGNDTRLQLVPASTTTKANGANSNDLRLCRPQEWQAQKCSPSPPNEREPSITGKLQQNKPKSPLLRLAPSTSRGEHRSARAASPTRTTNRGEHRSARAATKRTNKLRGRFQRQHQYYHHS
jgi:hypothetical protein